VRLRTARQLSVRINTPSKQLRGHPKPIHSRTSTQHAQHTRHPITEQKGGGGTDAKCVGSLPEQHSRVTTLPPKNLNKERVVLLQIAKEKSKTKTDVCVSSKHPQNINKLQGAKFLHSIHEAQLQSEEGYRCRYLQSVSYSGQYSSPSTGVSFTVRQKNKEEAGLKRSE
jgi:hypothetical protein